MEETIMDEAKFKKLKAEVEDARANAARAQGALAQLQAQLKSEFKVDSVKAARKLLEDLKLDKADAEMLFNKALKNYEQKWKQ